MTDYWSGFAISFSLILAIGSQNAFVLKQGLKREHVFIIFLFCALTDSLFISAGVLGFGAVTTQYPSAIELAKLAGTLFLLIYGLQSLYSSIFKQHAMSTSGQSANSLKKALLLCIGFTWLNPHVYLDTMVLIGMVSTHAANKGWFILGAVTASALFFFALGYGARLLSPLFTKAKAWNILDALVGILMLYLAWKLWHS